MSGTKRAIPCTPSSAKRPRPGGEFNSTQIMVEHITPDTAWAKEFANQIASGDIVILQLASGLQASLWKLFGQGGAKFGQAEADVVQIGDLQHVMHTHSSGETCMEDVSFLGPKVLRLLTTVLLGAGAEQLTNLLADGGTLSVARVSAHTAHSPHSISPGGIPEDAHSACVDAGLLTLLYAPSSGGSAGSGSCGGSAGSAGDTPTVPPALILLDATGQPVPLSAGEVAVWAGQSLQEATMGLVTAARYSVTHISDTASSACSNPGHAVVYRMLGSPNAVLDPQRFLAPAVLLRTLWGTRTVLTVGQLTSRDESRNSVVSPGMAVVGMAVMGTAVVGAGAGARAGAGAGAGAGARAGAGAGAGTGTGTGARARAGAGAGGGIGTGAGAATEATEVANTASDTADAARADVDAGNRHTKAHHRDQRGKLPENSGQKGVERLTVRRHWLQAVTLEGGYAPQMGDRVVYFPQGHTLCLAKFPRVGPRESSPPPWMALPTRWPLVECEVRDLQYALPSSNKEWKTCVAVKAILTLAVVRVPAQYEFTEGRYKVQFREYHPHSFTFTVTLRDSDLPDFLVPTDLFMRSMCLPLEGVPVSVAFKQFSEEEGRYLWDSNPGRVIGMSNAISSWPDSPWYAVGVKADGRYGEEGRVCMWDCTPTSRMRIWTACPMIHMDTAEAQRIQEEMEELLRGPDADLYSPFELQVDPKAFPQYYDQIALPMYTDLIRHRLGSGYYRQGAALEHDVQQLYLNCVAFNSDASEISVAGKRLRDQLLRIIRPSREGAGSGSGSGSSTGSGSGSGGGAGAGTGAGAGNGNGNGDGDGARAGAGTGAGAGAEAGAPHTYTTALASADTAGSVVFRYRSSSSGNRWPSGLVSLHRTDTVATLLHTVAGQLRLPVGEIKVFRLGKELHGDGTVGQLHMLGQLGQEESLVVALVPAKSALKSGKSSGTSGTPPRTPRTPLTTVSFAEGQGVEAQTRTQGPSRVFPEEKSEQPASMSIRVRRTTIAPASAPAPAAAPAAAPASAPSR